MSNSREKGLMLASSTTTINLAAAAGTEKVLYTAPPGYDFIPAMVILDAFSADEHATPPIITLGIGGGACDEFLGNQTLNTITANYAEECLILQPIPSATPATVDRVPAGSTFSLEITQANGAALTCTAHSFGFLRAA
jgi:hypothetical protein